MVCPSSPWTAAGASPGTARASWWSIRSSSWQSQSTSWITFAASKRPSFRPCANSALSPLGAWTAEQFDPRLSWVDGRSGVWVPSTTRAADPQAPTRDRKIAALGIRITRGVTMHGLALNCTNTLEYYDHIVACGIDDADVTTLSLELGREVTMEEASAPLLDALERALSGELTVADHSFASAPDPIKVANEKARQKRLAQTQQSGANKPE